MLDRTYRVKKPDLSNAIRRILDMHNVVASRPMIETGLAVLDAGGDFACGVVAFDSRWLGGDTFVSYDTKAAARLLEQQGIPTRLLKSW